MNWDYVAGYFDGEGTVCQHNCTLEFYNTNKESLDVMRGFIGFGVVEVKKQRPGNWLVAYRLRITNHEKVLQVIRELEPRCIVKRERLATLRTKIEGREWQRYNEVKFSSDELRRLYWAEGKSVRAIAILGGNGKSSIESALRRNGIPRRPMRTRSPALFEKAVKEEILK